MRLHLIPNSHIDPVWLWDKYEGIDEVLATFRSACDRLDDYPALTFSGSSLQFYEWVLQFDHALFARIQKKVAEGRWEVVGGWWVESDSNLPLESSIRGQARIAGAFSRKHFGSSSAVAYLPDSFGHPATLPKILAETGFKYFLFCRPGIHEKTDLPANLFWWDYKGKRVLAYRLKHHYNQFVPEPEQEHVLRNLVGDPDYAGNTANAFLFGVGDHGGGPTVAQIEIFDRLIRERPPGEMVYSSCQRFFEEAEKTPGIPVYSGNLHMHAVGCYSVMRKIKNAVRHAEQDLEVAVRAGRMAGTSSRRLDSLRKKLLFNQFHDILPGSCAPHAESQSGDELGGIAGSCRDFTYDALRSISAAQASRIKEGEFRIFNTLPYDVTVPLHMESFCFSAFSWDTAFRDSGGKAITVQRVLESVRCCNSRWEFVDTLPARGFKSYFFDPATPVKRPDGEAAHYQPGDAISSPEFVLQADGGMMHAAGLAQPRPLIKSPVKFLVLADESDTWGHGVSAYGNVTSEFTLGSSGVMTGPVTSKLYQSWSHGKSVVEIVWSLFHGLPQIYADITVYWAERRTILKMEIDAAGDGAQPYLVQGAGGAIACEADGAEMPLHRWIWLPSGKGQGLAVLQDGAFAYDCHRGRLRLTLVRSSLYGYDQGTKLAPHDIQQHTDQGIHQFRLCLMPQPNPSSVQLDRSALAFIEPFHLLRETRMGR
jgi:alpha-mannosidase